MMRRRWLLGVGLTVGARVEPSRAQARPEGFRVMAREKSLAEQFAGFLNEAQPRVTATYTKGVVLYAGAKAEFDGLISELQHGLDRPQPPDGTASFQAALAQAVQKRVAFTDFVTDVILPRSGGTTKGVGDFIKVVPELLKVLTDAGMSIWREYRSGNQERRKAIRDELEKLRWPPFQATSGRRSEQAPDPPGPKE